MKKIIIFLMMIFLILNCSKKEKPDFVIGITQIASHNALDNAREGFKSIFKDVNVKFIETNANGDISSLELNTKKLINQNVDLIYSISTPAAQIAKNNTDKIPIVFSAVTDAVNSNIIADNIVGVLDAVDVERQIDLLLSLDKNIKSIGVLYNSSEQNSVFQIEELDSILKKKNIKLITRVATQINEIPQAIKSLIEVSDAIYTPADNLVALGINIISENLIEAKKLSIAAEKAHVEKGILMTLGIDYYTLGQEAGNIAKKILFENKKISNFNIKKMEDLKFEYNEETAKKLGVKF